ncbi:vcbs repeat-containing protein [Anaeramoeba ignava]|uniref:Vcbs repeat-containing protein n=1 Tax=Anaeramoeba ignava TaxID=1746090 RepID=A0A9Q0R4P6_ANAIG|nr:vcbs repeat-containing protein [Anaeramoeba ignava]
MFLSGWPQRQSSTPGGSWGTYDATQGVQTFTINGTTKTYLFVPSDVCSICVYDINATPLIANNVFGGGGQYWGEVSFYLDVAYEYQGWIDCSVHNLRGNLADSGVSFADIDGEKRIIIITNQYDCIGGGYDVQFLSPFIVNIDRTRFVSSNHDWTVVPVTNHVVSNDYNVIQNPQWHAVPVDIDGDGDVEILWSGYDGCLHAYWLDKSEHYNWPYCAYSGSGTIYFSSEPAIVDIDDDGHAEIIITTWAQGDSYKNGKLIILSYSGDIIHSIDLPSPRSSSVTWGGSLPAPSIGRIAGTNNIQIVINTVYAGVVAYNIPDSGSSNILWPSSRGNYHRSGYSDAKIRSFKSISSLKSYGAVVGSLCGLTFLGLFAFVAVSYRKNNKSVKMMCFSWKTHCGFCKTKCCHKK